MVYNGDEQYYRVSLRKYEKHNKSNKYKTSKRANTENMSTGITSQL